MFPNRLEIYHCESKKWMSNRRYSWRDFFFFEKISKDF
jgi:hypothetical protein